MPATKRASRGTVPGVSNRKKIKAPRAPQPAPLAARSSAAIRATCSECGGPIRWVDAAAAAEHGLDVDQALEFLDSGRDDVEWWVCTLCPGGGVLSAASTF